MRREAAGERPEQAMSGVTPRPAATVALLREGVGGGVEVLLGRRSARMAFMAQVWVFPGGRIDPGDGAGLEGARRAAARETFEEVGLVLSRPTREAGGEEVWAGLTAEELRELTPFARWVTPAVEPRRYDTWFFVTEVNHDVRARVTPEELTEAAWLRPEAALRRHQAGDLALSPPTWWTLTALSRLESVAGVRAWAAEAASAIEPVEPTLEQGVDGVVLHLAGDGLRLPPGPELGRRLVLERGVWRAG